MKKWILLGALALSHSLAILPAWATSNPVNKSSPASSSATRSVSNQVNINTADAQALSQALVGIGPAKAKAIVEWRKKNGPFKSFAALSEVKGIGPAILERNKDRIKLR